MPKVLFQTFIVLRYLLLLGLPAAAQPVLPSDLKKPEKFEHKLLGAEKSADKKFGTPRRFIQNTVTHYNWYFNANNKLEAIIERAKLAHRDDFTQLLPFYNFSLESTAADKAELDSVIYKANMGILIHDLRNAWIDNLFMLMGKAYYFRNALDSAYLTFQYINYAFSPKEPGGYDMPIGSNANEGTSALSVATKEKNNIVQKVFTTPPNRNESFLWQIRTYIALNEMQQAAALIETLKNDPVFPQRLATDLAELQALWFYRQQIYDSAAVYLEQSLGNANNRQETSRWEFLIAQLYERVNQPERALAFYERARRHTLDPVLEVYAILNSIQQQTSDSAAIAAGLKTLRKMGRRDSYSAYRDIIYYTAARIEMDRGNQTEAKEMLLKVIRSPFAHTHPEQRTRSFLLLADISFQERNYRDAQRFSDSISSNDPGISNPIAFEKRKEMLHQAVGQLDIIHRQDSLQQIAAMPEAERDKLLKKLVRQLRRSHGLKDEEAAGGGNAAVGMNNANKAAPDLFAENTKGDWYFNNPALKSKGFTAFRQEWGNRPNNDNWRRQAALAASAPAGGRQPAGGAPAVESDSAAAASEFTYEGLLKKLPLSPEQLELSEDSVQNAMLDLAILYIDQFEEYPAAIDTLEHFAEKYPYSSRMPEALFYLYHAYRQTGRETDAASVNNQLNQKYTGTPFQQKVHDAETGESQQLKTAITHDYEDIYRLFIEGSFDEALRRKQISDSLYGSSYWTPQLLYIEAVYHLQSRNDAAAKKVLQDIIGNFSGDPMAEKAKLILEVLGRRKEIEDYLTALDIKREEDTVYLAGNYPAVREQIGTPMEQDPTTIQPIPRRAIDTMQTSIPGAETAPVAAPDSIAAPGNVARATDSVTTIPSAYYTFRVEAPHAVMIVLNKVDPVYVTESRNAFNRYNQEKYYNTTIPIQHVPLNDTLKLVVMTGFENAAAALQYLETVKAVAATRIIPWLPVGKYTFMVISESNIEVLKNRQDIEEYRQFEQQYRPDQ